MTKQPRQTEMAGMEDREIGELKDAALQYAEHRDERMAALKQEVELKASVLRLMKKHHKTKYNCKGIHIEVIVEKEKVKVDVKGKKKLREEISDRLGL